MKKRQSLKSTAAVMAGLIALTGTVSLIGYAAGQESTTTAEISTSECSSEASSETSSAEVTTAGTAEIPAENAAEAPAEEINWTKADISAYDTSLSLVSYEETTPEMLATVGVKTASEDGDPLTEEDVAAMTERRRKIKKLSPSLTRKGSDAEPTAVELYLSGKPVGEIPPAQGVHAEGQPGDFTFVTYGWGHGVGMSQNGANFYASYSGWTYQDILFHYYPGTFLMNTGLTDYEELTVRHQPYGEDTLDLVSQIVYNEVGGTMAYEAIKAQAVAVYTYIKYNGDDSNDLRPKANPPQIVIDACAEVLGEALFYDGDYALTMFYASSGGCTAHCYEIFYQDLPYLTCVPSDYDGAYDPHFGTVTHISSRLMKSKIEAAYGLELSDDPSNWIQPVYSQDTGYITDVLIDGQKYVKGYAFSLAMGLKSCKFDLFYTPPEDEEGGLLGEAPMPDVEMPDVPVSGILPDIQIPTEDPTEEPEEGTAEGTTQDPTEEPSEGTTGTTEEPTTSGDVTEPSTEEPATSETATEPETKEISGTEPSSSSK